MRLFFSLLLFLLLAGAYSCTVQQVDPTADIPSISFKSDISPIISANCALSGCHSGSGGEAGALLSYDDVIRYGDVKAADPHNSRLYKVIRSYVNGVAMPPSPNEPLTDQQIAGIYVWILQGAKNN